MVPATIAILKAVDEEVALRGGAVSALDAGIVVFLLAAAISVDYNVRRRVSAAGGAECCRGEKRNDVVSLRIF